MKGTTFQKNINCIENVKLSLGEIDISNSILEFVWFINGTNNIKYLLDNNHYSFVDILYKKYSNELDNLIKYYELEEIIDETEFFHDWFLNWKKLEKYDINQFTDKLKKDFKFYSIWGDFNVSDSLELRNWGLKIGFDNNDTGKIDQKGTDQLRFLIESISKNPENIFHIVNYYNVSNINDRTIPYNLLNTKFYCEKLNDSERVALYLKKQKQIDPELLIFLEENKNKNLDFIQFDNKHLYLPKYKIDIISDYYCINDNIEYEKSILFNFLFLKYVSHLFNMVPNNIYINSAFKKFVNPNQKKIKSYDLEFNKKNDNIFELNINEIILKKI